MYSLLQGLVMAFAVLLACMKTLFEVSSVIG